MAFGALLGQSASGGGGFTKNEILAPETPPIYNLGADATPNDMFQNIFNIGDYKTSIRTDLGEYWGLCNSQSYDRSTCPELYSLMQSRCNLESNLQIAAGMKNYKIIGNKSFAQSLDNTKLYYSNAIDELPDFNNVIQSTDINGIGVGSTLKYVNGYYIFASTTGAQSIKIAYSTDLNSWNFAELAVNGIKYNIGSIYDIAYFSGNYVFLVRVQSPTTYYWYVRFTDFSSTGEAVSISGVPTTKMMVSNDGTILCFAGVNSDGVRKKVYNTSFESIREGFLYNTGNSDFILVSMEDDVYIICSYSSQSAVYIFTATQSNNNDPTYTVSGLDIRSRLVRCYSSTGSYIIKGNNIVDLTSTPTALSTELFEIYDGQNSDIGAYLDYSNQEIAYNSSNDTILYNLPANLPNIPIDYGNVYIRKR